VIENMNAIPNPMAAMPGFDLMRRQQEAFMKTMMAGVPGWGGADKPAGAPREESAGSGDAAAELAEIKKQFAALQDKLSKL
jgi:hypothetical protein